MAMKRNAPYVNGCLHSRAGLCASTRAHPPAGEVLVLRHLNNLEPGQAHSTPSP